MKDITKRFPGVLALNKVRFQLRRGEVHVLLGENGAGKSTLIKILTGAYKPDEGTILLRGEEIRIDNPAHAQALGISAVYQEFNLIPHLDAGKNIFLGREPLKEDVVKIIDKRAIYERSSNLLESLGAKIDPRIPVKRLGVASQQMVEIAKALAANAEILVLDEPTAVLTEEETERLFSVVRNLTARGVAVIYISHRLEEVAQIGDRATVFRDGEYVATVDLKGADIDIDYLIQLMVGRRLDEKFPKARVEPGCEVLRVTNLSRKGVLHDISFSLRSGEILGLAGLVGAGRTELARAIFGADPIDGGEIYVEGRLVRIRSPRDAIALQIGLAPEDRKTEGLVQLLPVDRNIILASAGRVSHRGILNLRRQSEVSWDLVRSLRIVTPNLKQKVMYLSGGNQQKVVLAKWLASQSRIIIFDEPTRGIDVGAKVEVYQLMNELVRRGVGIIMISSELPEILAMSDRILVLHEGRITAELTREEATQEKILRYAAGGGERAAI
ncbi:MAG: sugar ABC transporter ATP-binding protein [Firmicutes bacterium]|nr:sugar ABC transporter ATP-binding protein [Bacillota bacterium]